MLDSWGMLKDEEDHQRDCDCHDCDHNRIIDDSRITNDRISQLEVLLFEHGMDPKTGIKG